VWIDRRGLRLAALGLALGLLATGACAQVLYKLVDRQGRVTYSDREPKGFDGTVTRIEADASSNVIDPPKSVSGTAAKGDGPGAAGAGAGPGLAGTRRETREVLAQRVRAAEAKVAAARKAKAEGEEPRANELQTVQRRLAPLKEGAAAPRPNCFQSVDAHGQAVLHCPSVVPQDIYYARRAQLDEDLRRAEEELAAAELAYRRGTD